LITRFVGPARSFKGADASAEELHQPKLIIEHILKVLEGRGWIKYAECGGGDLFMDVYWVSPELGRKLEGNGIG
jgi:hypothetical protein